MKIYQKFKCLFLAFPLLVSLGFSNYSAAADTPNTACQAYSIPLAPVPCDAGYTGKKFPMQTKVCPSGVVTTGQTFNTENCSAIGKQPPNVNETNCTLTPSAKGCSSAPSLKGCESGWHWSLSGSAVAHCVPDDMICPWGQSLTHNALGYPSCVQNTCPSNQVLQADGIACGCSSGLVWNGSSCVVPCIPSSNTQTGSCPAGYTGNATRIASFICPSQTTTYSPWDNSACSMTCQGTTAVAGACPIGYTGNIITTTKYSGPSCTSNSSVDTSGCKPKFQPVCANGAVNYPTCTPPKYIYLCNYGQLDIDNYITGQGYTIAHFLDSTYIFENNGSAWSVDTDPNVAYITGYWGGGGQRWGDVGNGRMTCYLEGH